MALHAQVLSVLDCAVKQAGEGFAVFLVVVVKKGFLEGWPELLLWQLFASSC